MTTSRQPWPLPEETPDVDVARLRQENAELRQAIDSRAMVDQAVGVLIATYGIPAAVGFEVPREVSPHTNSKLRRVAEALIGCVLGRPSRSRWAGSWTRQCGGARDTRMRRITRARRSAAQGLLDGGMAANDLVDAEGAQHAQDGLLGAGDTQTTPELRSRACRRR
ncbi:ANTAR domain-containing protein [Streptomyces sp. NBC_00989]|uniref:ANTAR domain-containing protein n=1 Tax=Streptomyces sp. NBC_00989 TaxID=2903705 RepID=UPI0038663D56